MKTLLSLILLCLLIVGGARSQTCTTTISTYPYYQNFEASAGGWTASATGSWALGTPAKSVINSAASGTKAWVTGLTGPYSANEQSYVESPCFNTTTLVQPMIEMKVWWNSEFSWDGAVLQSSVDGGTTWQNVGQMGDPFNWYNDNTINGAPGDQSSSTAEGWTGRVSTSNGSNGWVTVKHPLTGLAGKTNLKLRIAFGADPSIQDDGFAFDDVSVFETPANDASVIAITNPVGSVQPNVSTPITVNIKNFGTATLTSATMGFSVNGTVVTNSYAFSGNVAQNQTSGPVTIGNYSFPAGVYTIKAWSRLPNGVADGNPGNDTTSILIYSCSSLNGTYTINKNSATGGTNYQSFSAAAQALSNCGVNGPVIFNVVTGTGPYTEALTLGNINGTSATNTITFNGNGNALINPSTTGEALKIDGGQYFRFNNLKVKADPTATAGDIISLVNAAQYNIFTGCAFTHSTSTSSTSHVVFVNSGSSNNTFQNDSIIGGYYGIYNYGASSSINANNQFLGNIIRDPYYYAVYSGYNSGTLYEGNDISRPTRTNAGFMYGFYLTTSNTGITVSKNRIHNTHDVATTTSSTIYGVYSSSAGTVGSENIIKNNAIYNINNNVGALYGFYNTGGNNTYYYHNTVSADDPNTTYTTLRGMYFSSASTNVKFINNLVSLSSTATTKHAIYLSSTSISLNSNNNDLYAPGGNVGYYSGNKATLTDWQAANSSAYDQASVSADPQFVNLSTGNLKPTNSSVNNIGQAVPTVLDDITGAPRSTTTPDPGAYEFTPAQNDASLVSITSPVSPVTPMGSQPVTITIKNSGLANLTSATITWSVNGTAQTSYNWTGNLTTNQTSAPITIGNYSFPAGTFALNICIANPNGQPDANPGNDCQTVSIISCNALAGTYTIDQNSGASATNFVSFASAINTLNSCGISAPVTFNVVPTSGPYNESVTIMQISGASATNTVTFNGNANTIISPNTTADAVVKLNGTQYVRINNLKMEANANATSGAVLSLINAAEHNTFTGNTITHSTTTTSTSQAVYIYSGSSNNTFQNNTVIGAYYGIYNYGSSTANNTNNSFIGNTIRDPYYYGIYNYYSPNSLIESNDISRPTRTNAGSMYGIYNSTGGTGLVVSKNRIHNTHDASTSLTGSVYGIYTSADGTVGSENIIKNNAIYNLNNTSGYVYALYNSSGSNTYYYYNTVTVDNPTASFGTLRGMYFSSSSTTNVKFINNIINLTSSASTSHAIYIYSTSTSLVSNNNDLYAPTGNVGYYGGNVITLADWKLVNSGAYDQNSVSADPVFVNPATGDLHPTIVAVNDLGQPVPGITDDITGATRNVITPDMGAFEFTVNPNDVGIIDISGPSTSGCGLSATERITVTIKNFGSTTQTNIPLSYKLNGVPTGTATYVGSIAANATDTLTFSTRANMSTSGPYTIVATTSLTGDANASNDTDTLRITNSLIPGLPMTFDFETATTGIARFRTVINSKSNIYEDTAASRSHVATPGNPAIVSTKGMIMDGIDNTSWIPPVGVTDPWVNNMDNFSAAYICISPAGGAATDSLWLTFDLKQLFKTANANTNFRVTVDGTQVGPTYRPPFTGSPIVWNSYKVDLTAFKNQPTVQIGLESSVKEAFANGTGTANLLDNVQILRHIVAPVSGTKADVLAAKLSVYPNPSNGNFNVSLQTGKAYSLEVTDLAGKTVLKQTSKGDVQLKLENAAKGVYLLKVQSEGNATVRKLIVE